jgi:hypothetical protein
MPTALRKRTEETMQTNQLTSLEAGILSRVVGGRESGAANYQRNVIGVQAAGTTIGLSEDGGRTDYGLCLNDAMNRNFTPKQIKQTCGKPPAPVSTGGAP